MIVSDIIEEGLLKVLLPPATMNGYAMAPIFKALKKNDPQKYRKAVAKFFTELTAELKNQKVL